jgi:hypothetical protein
MEYLSRKYEIKIKFYYHSKRCCTIAFRLIDATPARFGGVFSLYEQATLIQAQSGIPVIVSIFPAPCRKFYRKRHVF